MTDGFFWISLDDVTDINYKPHDTYKSNIGEFYVSTGFVFSGSLIVNGVR